MNRRELLQLAAGGAAILTALSARAQTQEATGGMTTQPLPLTERGSVLPTRGPVTRTALPLNSSAGDMRYGTPYRFGMGGTQIGNIFAPIRDEQAGSVLQAAWDAGVRYFDTSPFYGYGLGEHRLGYFLRRQNRDEYIVSTKVGCVFKKQNDSIPENASSAVAVPFFSPQQFVLS